MTEIIESTSFFLNTPVGPIRISGDAQAIHEVHFLKSDELVSLQAEFAYLFADDGTDWLIDKTGNVNQADFDKLNAAIKSINHKMDPAFNLLVECKNQLTAYFSGSAKRFDLPLTQRGTPFQTRVWEQLSVIRYGDTISYLELAKRLGDPKVIRAAASANGKNHLAIIIPCHRVIGSSGELVGYGGGMQRKKWLLEHEKKFTHGVQTLF